MKNQYKIGLSVGVPFGIFTIALALLEFSSSPWKQWGGSVAVVYVASTLIIHASQEILGKFPRQWLPYVVATFTPIVLVAFFASAPYNSIALITLLSITGVVTYYWVIAIVVDEAKKIRRRFYR